MELTTRPGDCPVCGVHMPQHAVGCTTLTPSWPADVQQAADFMQECIADMTLVSVYAGMEPDGEALGNVTLRDLMLMWLDNLWDDQHAGGDHAAEIAKINAVLAAIAKVPADPADAATP